MNHQILSHLLAVTSIVLFLAACGAPAAAPTATLLPPTDTVTPMPPTETPTPAPTPEVEDWWSAQVPSAGFVPAEPEPEFDDYMPISQQDSQKLIEEWGLLQVLHIYDALKELTGNREKFLSGDLELDFGFENPPEMTLVEEAGQKYFQFELPMPKGSSTSTVIFSAPEAGGATVKIPRFSAVPMDSEDPNVTCISANRFHAYDGTYDFKICMIEQGFGYTWVVDLNVFYDGSEHHIYEEVELFGVKFTNNFGEPLVFRIDGDKYVYVKGNGTATTKDGASVQFGQ